MKQTPTKRREEARRLYLSGELTSNAEIAKRLKVKPHTVGRWRKEEGWDDLRMKIDRRASEMLVEKLATDRVTLNVRHFRIWELLLVKMMEDLKARPAIEVDEMVKLAGIMDRAQKGQRLAKGLSVTGESEEQIRAEAEATQRKLIDAFIDAVKDNVSDEDVRDRIRKALLESMPAETIGAGEGE
ncbi:MAG: phage terminase small subunit-related protein [Candidatus Eisenbacteria bacterium]|nr:phage terminase small subunit-related protein [Candidatus Eisenbacteria bacterium]